MVGCHNFGKVLSTVSNKEAKLLLTTLPGEQEAKFCGHSDTYSEYFSGESADDGEDTLMDLEQELNDIKMAVNNSISIPTVSEAMSLDG